jgi:hypothetical protein
MLPAVTTAEVRTPLRLPLKVMAVVLRGGQLTAPLRVTPGKVRSQAEERREDDSQTQVMLTVRT